MKEYRTIHEVSGRFTSVSQLCPRIGHGGMAMFRSTFSTTCSGITRIFTEPIFGCKPRPRKSEGGSATKLPVFCTLPSMST